ncbi:DUF349 domain-containing protein [Tessaracoccus sp. ZS01]|uniref:DUF349 domain-containing protein n=1 Tax=Tessaracoccus sp. ZS01 TaxID=1906324 RepID=UPI00096BE5A7|nr:DUF349 domain-containing protein [Tessaracoccus sp. ZS01]MCG6566561.1 DUF349 domain-containing protein [Tessaracoccus sp. ZS01]OMG58990.1 DNA repair protein [Tessaracoccus sp. ZS01]
MSEQQAPADFGRVDADGTVYVITGDTERSVGQIPDSTPEEAMAFYVRRYENLAAEVTLLESRVKAQAMSPEEARTAIETAKKNVAEANAVGDLPALTARLEAVSELLPAQIEARKAQRAEQNAVTVAAKEAMVVEAEQLAAGNDWRGGVDRFRTLLDEWKALPRIDRATDNELWHRFSSARTQYTRRRKAHFSELNSHRDDAKAAKEAIIAEAEPLATSTDWGATSAAFRDLMTRWKAAGSARRADDDKLWARFRGIQDEFFNARSEAQNAADGEQSENLAAKQALVEKVEKDLEGVTDIEAAKSIHRDFLAQFNEIGHVPRNAMRDMDNRVRTLGEKVSELEAEEWRRTDPEARERAESTVKMFEDQIAKLEQDLAQAQERGDDKKAKDAQKSIETYTSWLEQARETLADFTK